MSGLLDQVASAWFQWDTLVSQYVRQTFERLRWADLLAPPSAPLADQYFVYSPTPVVTAIVIYLTIIGFSLVVKPSAPQPGAKDSTALKVCVQLHNAFLVILSCCMSGEVVRQALKNNYKFWGNQYDPNEVGMAWAIYIFYLSKIYEFFDTVRRPHLLSVWPEPC